MPDKWPLANDNWSNAANWNDGTKPVPGDDVFADGRTVTIDEDVTVASIRTTQRSGGTAGGGFTLNAGITVTANIIGGAGAVLTRSVPGADSVIIGDVFAGPNPASGLVNNSTAKVTIIGDVTAADSIVSAGASNSSTGQIEIIGNVFGANSTSAAFPSFGVQNLSSGVIQITGNAIGGPGLSAIAVRNAANGAIYITGNATGGSGVGSIGAVNASTGTLRVSGLAIGNDHGLGFATNNGNPGVFGFGVNTGVAQATTTVGGLKFGAKGQTPITGLVQLELNDPDDIIISFRRPPADSFAEYVVSAAPVLGGQPAQADVRFGTEYNFGLRTGTLRVPAPQFVNAGVLTDDTIGTLAVDLQPILDAIGAIDVDLNPVLDKLPTTGRALSDADYEAPLDSTQTQQAAAAAITAAGLALEATSQSILEDTGTTLPGLIAGIDVDPNITVNPTELSGTSVDAIRSGLATSDNVTAIETSILAKIGAFTGTGVNTILGFLRAIARKDVAAPSDMGGDYDPATDSQEAIRDRGDAAWTGSAAPSVEAIAERLLATPANKLLTNEAGFVTATNGGTVVGPNAQLVTFDATDNDGPVSGVSIRIAGREITTLTNGQRSITLDPATYTATIIVPNGYQEIQPIEVIVVDEPVVEELTLVATSAPTPSAAPLTTVQLPTEDQYGNRIGGVSVQFEFLGHLAGATITGTIMNTPAAQLSNDTEGSPNFGICVVQLRRLARYRARYNIVGDGPKVVTFETGNTGSDLIVG